MKVYTQKEIWLHKLLTCIYEEKGLSEIENLVDVVYKHMPEDEELAGQILDFIYDTRKKKAMQYFGVQS